MYYIKIKPINLNNRSLQRNVHIDRLSDVERPTYTCNLYIKI